MPVFVNDYGIKIINMCVIILREKMIDQIAKVSSNFYWEQEITKPEKFIESNPIENHSSPPSYFILPPLQYSRNSRPFRDLFSQGRPSLPSPSVRPPHNRTSIERQWKVDVQFSMFSKDSSPFSPTRGTRLQRCRCLAGVKSKEYRFGMCVGGC